MQKKVRPCSFVLKIIIILILSVLLFKNQFVDGENSSSSCNGIMTSRRAIVDGKDAERHIYPYMASLTSKHEHKCGGTLIAPDIILTAAHCSQSFGEIQLNRNNISDELETYTSLIARQILTHPRYYRNEFLDVDPYDIALVHLFGGVNLSSSKYNDDYYQIIPINRNNNLPTNQGDELLVIGWGATDLSDLSIFSDTLQQANVHYIPNDQCEMTTGMFNGVQLNYKGRIIDVVLCAMDVNLTMDSCRGDSGGPLLLDKSYSSAMSSTLTSMDDIDNQNNNNNELDRNIVQVGITSAGFGCAHPELPAFYARTSSAHEWIDEIVCQLSKHPPSDFQCTRSEVNHDNNGDDTATFPKELFYQTLDLSLQLDAHPNERGWILETKDFQTGLYTTIHERPIFSYTNKDPYSTVTEALPNLQVDQHYWLTLLDSFGDGNDLNDLTISITTTTESSSTNNNDNANNDNNTSNEDSIEFIIPPEKVGIDFRFFKTFHFTLGPNPPPLPTMPIDGAMSPPSMEADSDMEKLLLFTIAIDFGYYPPEIGYHLEIRNIDDQWETIKIVYPGTFAQSLLRRTILERIDILDVLLQQEHYDNVGEFTFRFTITSNEGYGLKSSGSYGVWLGNVYTGQVLVEGGDDFTFEAVHEFVLSKSLLLSLLDDEGDDNDVEESKDLMTSGGNNDQCCLYWGIMASSWSVFFIMWLWVS